jgi:hypothetical protein
MSDDKQMDEINQPAIPEIQQPDIKEFERSTEHPDKDNTQIQSEEMRYENADKIYE